MSYATTDRLERYRRLFEDSRDGIYITDRSGAFVDVNASLSELTGWSREELLGTDALSLYEETAQRIEFQRELEQRGSVQNHEVKIRTREGRILHCLLSATVLRAQDGSISGYQGIVHDISDRKRAERQLLHNAFHDALTGLPNRALFLDRLERLIRHVKRHRDFCYAVVFLDLDRFKAINDSLGHLVGDELLRLTARRLEKSIRGEDTAARLGGDEFAVLLDSVDDVSDATRVAERISNELQLPYHINGHEIPSSASLGIALSSQAYNRPEEVLRDADAAMYRAKAAGGARYELFDTRMHAQAAAQMQMETDLRQALDQEQFHLQYQPIVNLETEKLVGFEALLRWLHPDLGVLYPNSFIPLAEDTGLIVPLGWATMRRAVQQLQDWKSVDPHLCMSVNLSARQIMQPDFVDKLAALLTEVGLESGLELEITESVFMENAESVIALLARLRDRGIRLCIDDFGTGFSSLNYLQKFSIDSLKIDRSFIGAMGDGSNLALVNTIAALARNLGIEAIAEGVETNEQLGTLRALGTRYAQGFLISRPLHAPAATGLLESRDVPGLVKQPVAVPRSA